MSIGSTALSTCGPATSQVSVEQANEALADDERILVDPDPKSRSG